MINLSSIYLFIASASLLVFFPGVNTFYIMTKTIEYGTKGGIISSFGIQLGTIVYMIITILGLSALIMSSAIMFNILKYLGAFYLIYLGINNLIKKMNSKTEIENNRTKNLFFQGLYVNLLNPKTGLFFIAFLPQFIDVSKGQVTLQIIMLGFLLIFLSLLSDLTYTFVAGYFTEFLKRKTKLLRVQNYLTAFIYIALGVFMIWLL